MSPLVARWTPGATASSSGLHLAFFLGGTMNKQTQTQVRVLAEDMAGHAHEKIIETMVGMEPSDVAYGAMVGSFEVARQVALLVEEQRAQRKLMEEALTRLIEVLKGGRDE